MSQNRHGCNGSGAARDPLGVTVWALDVTQRRSQPIRKSDRDEVADAARRAGIRYIYLRNEGIDSQVYIPVSGGAK